MREADRARFVKLGHELARSAFEHVGKKATDKALETAARALRASGVDELLARLGAAEITAHDVVQSVYPELTSTGDGDEISPRRAVIGLEPGPEF